MRRGPMRTGRLTVIYIAGAGRSGSTILDRILGTVPRVTSCNETVRVWRNGFLENLGCACGSRFRDCSFWSAVAEEAFPSGEPNPERTDGLQWEVSRSRYFPRLLADPSPQSSFGARLAEYRATLGPLYRAIAEVSGCDVLVDSSKLPGEALVLAGIPGIDVRVVHLVRDARAVAHSWRRDRRDPGLRRRQDRHRPLFVAAYWSTRNTLSEMLRRRLPYVRVRYEDMMGSPRTELQRLMEAVDVLNGRDVLLSGDRTVCLEPVHTMSGNPQRFETGPTELRSDVEWKRTMPATSRAAVTAMTLPLLIRYGYVGAGKAESVSAFPPAVGP
ncbi:sulfotransferase [Gemmatimonadota bacterium]